MVTTLQPVRLAYPWEVLAFRISRGAVVASTIVLVGLLAGCGGKSAGTWPISAADHSGTRAAAGSSIDADNVAKLRPRWRFAFTAKPSFSGIYASTPVADHDTVYIQDLESNVYALDRDSGKIRWTHHIAAQNDGPNGLAVDGGRVYGATDTTMFALASANGRLLWNRRLVSRTQQFVDVAPVPWKGLVFTSTIGYAPWGRGTIYALDAATGMIRWSFDTIAHPWPHPLQAGGGGLWYPVSIDDKGRLYAGNSNPTPWGGSPEYPNGAAFPGAVPYTDSLIVLDAASGKLLWYDQVTPHDVRDQDFQVTPILGENDTVFGAGKAGRVIAWDRETRTRIWETKVGLHRNDTGPLPPDRVVICPGLLGGVETPMAYADGRLFVPVVDLCGYGSATTRQPVTTADPAKGRGRLVALDGETGRRMWERRFPSPAFGCATVANDVVFTATYDGTVYGLDVRTGRTLWHARMRAGINACPAVVGDTLLVGAGVKLPGRAQPELVAYALPRG
jgi:outer membrane protein assembly factor BamB